MPASVKFPVVKNRNASYRVQIAIEDSPILCSDDVKSMDPPKLCESRFGKRWVVALSLYGIMLEPRGFGEEEDPAFILVVYGRRVRQRSCDESRRSK